MSLNMDYLPRELESDELAERDIVDQVTDGGRGDGVVMLESQVLQKASLAGVKSNGQLSSLLGRLS